MLGRRVRTAAAELDLLLERGDILRVVEVKTSRRPRPPGGLEPPRERLGPRQRERLERAARHAARKLGHRRLRLTLAECTLGLPRPPAGPSDRPPGDRPGPLLARLAAALAPPAELRLRDRELMPRPDPRPWPEPGPAPRDRPGFTPCRRSVDG